uniref:HAT C-terminal dimerisation domain-containing protein n=1 Tax=Ganoderma boninense TaxID=34458 RepID=A0A5K1K1W0_9APHY|nr:Uncharacterized protein [Ganoderma boninense]
MIECHVNLTCDAWQALNVDGYFTVTGHWIEEPQPGVWEFHNTLLGFVWLNNAHNGVRLGQAMFKVGFAECLTQKTRKRYDPIEHHVRCLEHIINLATQALLAQHTKSKYYDPASLEDDLHIQHSAQQRDEVGLVCALCVKPDSVVINIQDAQTCKASMAGHVNKFVIAIRSAERDHDKRQKLLKIDLSNEEWARVDGLTQLLEYTDDAQQSFSADHAPSLHHALPALEALHMAWTCRANRRQFALFKDALDAGIATISEYYNKTDVSDIYTIAMLLDPSQKNTHLKKHWDSELYKAAMKRAEDIFRERYEEMHVSSSTQLQWLFQQLSDDDSDEDGDDAQASPLASGMRPSEAPTESDGEAWCREFNLYLDALDYLGERSIVEWWGINAARYPVWASLARDHLSIMASSVSSERAFSSAGITISKQRNQLKRDIVDALQSLKCAIREDLPFCKIPGSGAGTELAEEELMDNIECTDTSSVADKSESAAGGDCYDWLSSKIKEEAYETSKGVDEHLCSKSGAGLDSQAGDKMY